jgi:hypothetical protein
MHTIGRGSIHSIKILPNLFYSKGPVEGERVGNGTLFPVRSDDKDISYLLKRLCQYDDAFGMDAIVIGNQDHHRDI